MHAVALLLLKLRGARARPLRLGLARLLCLPVGRLLSTALVSTVLVSTVIRAIAVRLIALQLIVLRLIALPLPSCGPLIRPLVAGRPTRLHCRALPPP